jgi:PAS domain S-box-containing protein
VASYFAAGFLKRIAITNYAFAALAVTAALGMRLALDPILGTYSPYLPYVAAILVVTRIAGHGPALAATILSCLSVWYFFLAPRYSFGLAEPTAVFGLGLFAVIAVAISYMGPAAASLSKQGELSVAREAIGPLETPLLRRIAMLTGAALALGVLASVLWNGFERSRTDEALVEHTYQVLNAAAAVRSHLENAESSQRGYLLTGEDRYLLSYQSAITAERKAATELRRFAADNPSQQKRLNQFDLMAADRLDHLAATIEVRRQKGAIPAADLVRTSGGKELMDRARAILGSVDDEERRLLHLRVTAASQADSRTRWILGLGSGSLVLLLMLAALSIERHLHHRKLAEVALARQARLIDLSGAAIITADGNRVITGWNAGAQEVYGWSSAEAIGRVLHELLDTNSSIPLEELNRVLARDGRWHGELTHARADGRQIVVESTQVLQRDAAGRPSGYLEINRDITERKRAEEALRESETQLRNLGDNLPESAIYRYRSDVQGNRFVDFISAGIERMTGIPPAEFIRDAATVEQSIVPEDRERLRAAVDSSRDQLTRFEVEVRHKHRVTGEIRWSILRSTPTRHPDGSTTWDGIELDITERKRTEESLRQNEAVLRSLFDSPGVMRGMVEVADGAVIHLSCNRAAAEMYGIDERSIAGKTAMEGGASEDVVRTWFSMYEECRRTGMPVSREYGRRDAAGKERWLLATASYLCEGPSGNPRFAYNILDLTDRRRTEEALRESETEFRTLANAIPQLCWMADGDGWIFWYNNRWYEYTGTTPEQMEGWGWQSVHDPGALPLVLERWKASIDAGEPLDMVFPLRGADGVFHPFLTRVTPVRDADGKVVRWFGTNTDISEQRRTEEALRESQARLEAALASMTDAVLISDVDGRFLHINDAFATFHKFKTRQEGAKTLAGYPAFLEVFFPDGTLAPLDMWAVPRALRGETATNAEYKLHRKDTDETWIGSYSFAPIRGQDGAVVGAVVVGRDITDVKQAEEEIRRLNTDLEQRVLRRTAQLAASNKELETFAYSVSHDLRAPLRGIDGWSMALLEDYGPQLEPRAREYLGRVRSETQRMGHLIDDMLQLSRIARADMHRTSVDLSRIAESIAARLRETCHGRSLEFEIRPWLMAIGDGHLLEIALTNLLENAVKFTGPRERAHIEFDAAEHDGKSAFVIRDNGVGFEMAYASALFGAFQRLHSESEFPGTGIGLATVQRIIHRHGGRIWAESQPNRGASFYFTLGT